MNAVYLGLASKPDLENPLHCFCTNGSVKLWHVSSRDDFVLQNALQVGCSYDIQLENFCVMDVTPCPDDAVFPCPPVQVTPGEHTIKNLLATAIAPMGSTLYIYGGGWNWQDTGAGPQAVTIGPSPSWSSFFHSQDPYYNYRNDSFFPNNGRNVYYFAGLDCSGYLGWVVYNTLHSESGLCGYVQPAIEMAQDFTHRGWGEWGQHCVEPFHPGDVCSIPGHVWLCIGTCKDGSVLLAHSTPSESRFGSPGGGVQISAMSPENDPDCEALRLATSVTKRCFPAWSRRYIPVLKDYADYTEFTGCAGRFRWAIDGSSILTDPDGISALSADEVLNILLP